MMSLLGAILVVVPFSVLIHVFRLVETTKEVINIARQSLETMRNDQLGEDEKEIIAQKNALKLFGLLGVLLAGSVSAILFPLLLIRLSELIGWFSLDGVLIMLQRWDFMIGAVFLGLAAHSASVKWL